MVEFAATLWVIQFLGGFGLVFLIIMILLIASLVAKQ